MGTARRLRGLTFPASQTGGDRIERREAPSARRRGRVRLELLGHLGEVPSRYGLTEFGLDSDLVEEVVGELPRLVEVGSSGRPVDVAVSVGDLDTAKPQLLRAIL